VFRYCNIEIWGWDYNKILILPLFVIVIPAKAGISILFASSGIAWERQKIKVFSPGFYPAYSVTGQAI
jgi:hypothetical protein